MRGEEQIAMKPWWRGFKGEIVATAKHKYDVHGIIRKLDDTTVEITELPIHKWTQNYKSELEAMIAGGENKEGVIKVCFSVVKVCFSSNVGYRITRNTMITPMYISSSVCQQRTCRKPRSRAFWSSSSSHLS